MSHTDTGKSFYEPVSIVKKKKSDTQNFLTVIKGDGVHIFYLFIIL